MRTHPKTPHLLDPEINLTPLIDVVFVVLIMFIVIAPLLQVDKIALSEAGEKTTNASNTENKLTIHVEKNDQVLLNQHPVAIKDLLQHLQKIPKQSDSCILYHDKEARFGTYQRVKNAVESAGYTEMNIVLLPSSASTRMQ